ncbi:hypothetical protein L913_3147 [Escherichia coli SCD2]|nr:hypothetical protein L913_3147 [Escherichia coli SCD2]KDV83848.1 hypothetical protein AC95_2051 [Escherichia coli 2-052-05_S4_C2]
MAVVPFQVVEDLNVIEYISAYSTSSHKNIGFIASPSRCGHRGR